MHIERFYDQDLAHASYAVLSNKQIVFIDPARDPGPYYEFTKKHDAKITAVIETHLHADFVSSHLEIHHTTGATLYVSKLANATYPHTVFDQGDIITVGQVKLKAFNTPGHSPDSISIVVTNAQGKDQAVFTGDTLFVGDVGRPDLRENTDDFKTKREEFARQLYRSTRNVLVQLERDVQVYPAHGAGSLCGKNISSELSSTIGKEVEQNYALQPMREEEFIRALLQDQPYIPKYFSYNVAVNKKGANAFHTGIEAVPRLNEYAILEDDILIVDARPQQQFKAGHLPGAINIMNGQKFETWLGSIVAPEDVFYLIAESSEALEELIRKAAKIGYEKSIKGALLNPAYAEEPSFEMDIHEFKEHPEAFHIIDVRTDAELNQGKIFGQAIHIPLSELPERSKEVNTDKPIVVHCASGYRSAIGASILEKSLPDAEVYDLSKAVKEFKSQR